MTLSMNNQKSRSVHTTRIAFYLRFRSRVLLKYIVIIRKYSDNKYRDTFAFVVLELDIRHALYSIESYGFGYDFQREKLNCLLFQLIIYAAASAIKAPRILYFWLSATTIRGNIIYSEEWPVIVAAKVQLSDLTTWKFLVENNILVITKL